MCHVQSLAKIAARVLKATGFARLKKGIKVVSAANLSARNTDTVKRTSR